MNKIYLTELIFLALFFNNLITASNYFNELIFNRMANELHTIKLGSTEYPICAKNAYSTATTSEIYPVGIKVSGTNGGGTNVAATIYHNSSVKITGTQIDASGGFYEQSDERLKSIVKPVSVNLEKLSKLRKIYFYWKEAPSENDKRRQLGLIAQDVQKLYPELVSTNEETGILSLAYDKLSVIALEGLDVVYQENKALKERINILENNYHELEEKLIDLEYLIKNS